MLRRFRGLIELKTVLAIGLQLSTLSQALFMNGYQLTWAQVIGALLPDSMEVKGFFDKLVLESSAFIMS